MRQILGDHAVRVRERQLGLRESDPMLQLILVDPWRDSNRIAPSSLRILR
jgi:hypothetical protein